MRLARPSIGKQRRQNVAEAKTWRFRCLPVSPAIVVERLSELLVLRRPILRGLFVQNAKGPGPVSGAFGVANRLVGQEADRMSALPTVVPPFRTNWVAPSTLRTSLTVSDTTLATFSALPSLSLAVKRTR